MVFLSGPVNRFRQRGQKSDLEIIQAHDYGRGRCISCACVCKCNCICVHESNCAVKSSPLSPMRSLDLATFVVQLLNFRILHWCIIIITCVCILLYYYFCDNYIKTLFFKLLVNNKRSCVLRRPHQPAADLLTVVLNSAQLVTLPLHTGRQSGNKVTAESPLSSADKLQMRQLRC